MEVNYLLIVCAVIMLICVIRGATKGMLRIVFGLVAWIALICFVNFGSEYVSNYIYNRTEVTQMINERIAEHLKERYNESEENEAGSGQESIIIMVPSNIREKIDQTVQSSIDSTISVVASELTFITIRGISIVISLVVGAILLYIISRIIVALGYAPGIRDVNRLLGIIAGLIEGMLIIWLIMFIADCFPASALGYFVANNVENDQILFSIYQNNLIERIIGI